MDTILWSLSGVFHPAWWGYVLYTLMMTQVTIAAVTIFLHRYSAHRALELHPIPKHFFRFWIWLTTGIIPKVWAAIHRKHHAKCETVDDPHSPQILGLEKVMFEGAELYRAAAKDTEWIAGHTRDIPEDYDWLEKNLYASRSQLGIGLMLVINVILFGPIGITIWAVQMAWIPIWAAGVINGLGHYYGYRNFHFDEAKDSSMNIFPWGFFIGGEELHNNHHKYGHSAKLSLRRYEFDIGWLYIRVLETLGLAKVKYIFDKKVLARQRVCRANTLGLPFMVYTVDRRSP